MRRMALFTMALVVLAWPAWGFAQQIGGKTNAPAVNSAANSVDDPPATSPRIESVVPLARQPQETDAATIWYDAFDGVPKAYTESSGGLDANVAFGGSGRSMPCLYEAGKHGEGNRKVFFGDSPTGKVVRRGQTFTDVYWRIYVRHQDGWTGGSPAKMSRATSIVSGRWNQAMISHVWGSNRWFLTLDPASGVRGETVATTKYNDFGNLHWLGNRPWSKFPIHAQRESGWWVCVESRAKLNTPGKADGVNQLWIDGRLEAERTGLNWRGSYRGHGINAVFLESYWNEGSPIRQMRWYDNFVISTSPIGPVLCGRNPTLIKTAFRGRGDQAGWEAELAADADGRQVVWQSSLLAGGDRAQVDAKTGRFVGSPAGGGRLAAGARYWCRVREKFVEKSAEKSDVGEWSQWSPWHQCFATGQ